MSELTIEQQRKVFSHAESLAHNPKSQIYKRSLAQLDGYPLRPYVEQKTLIKYPYMANQKAIESFLDKYKYSPLDWPLRKKWLAYLAKQKKYDLFENYYRDIGDTAINCQHAEILLKDEKSKQQAFNLAERYWVVGKSQPKACDTLFRAWKKAGKQTPELVWKRLSLAADGGDHTLIPYLKTLLPTKQQYLADIWLKVRRSPSQVSRISNFPNKIANLEQEIISYGLKRLVWQDRDLALRSWEKLSKTFKFSDEQKKSIFHRFAISLALINHDQAELWLEKASHYKADEELARWHLAHVLRQLNWQQALQVIQSIPEGVVEANIFQYWQARSYENLKAADLATENYAKLAEERHYYGFMASGKLSQMANLNDRPLTPSQQNIEQVTQFPAAQRALEFRNIGRQVSARREWNFLQSQLTPEQKATAAVIADQLGWHDQAIFGFSKSGYLDDLARRFPMPFDTHLEYNAKKNNIELAWAFAIARRESSFMPDAASGVGALGLMQIMPGTARYLTKKKVSKSFLFNPEKNVELGTQYMRYLLDKMNNNPILATASYNAGWRRVQKWLPEKDPIPMDLWIETIPYKETRNYVKAVLAYKQIYSQHLGNKNNSFKQLVKMEIGPKG
ncbi:lytic transglycosylase domain-containing protein [Paraglaciecola sp. L3A3]|uniref:lytic transglycosylase domain-containing protein n=1 Tax=Paraglaciecola sp. L3A3 TaxID=2686358 RepID=UPI00131B67A1|nr:lytic transglycosylase domain-containing protein [Paraglaciecola sp. L3A3]